MSQIVPDLEFPSVLVSEEDYSSIDDTPQPVGSDDKFLSHLLAGGHSQCLQQSMKFHLGTTVTCQPEVTSPLPDIVPTHFSPENLNCISQISFQEQTDQLVPDISLSQSFDLPDNWIIPPSPNMCGNGDQESYYPNRLNNALFHRIKPNNNIPIEWRSTKLPSDESEALRKALQCFCQRCPDKVCKKGKCLLDELVKNIQRFKVVDSDERQMLEYLLKHRRDCTEYFCIAPGCSQLEKPVNSLGELIDCINKKVSKELRYSKNAKFYRFSSNCCVKCPQDVNETTMYSFTSPNSISIYHNNNRWATVTVLGYIMQDILPLLIKIGNLSNHPNILPLDWLIDDQTISYSSEHYAEPLKYKFDIIDMNKKQIILQLIEAALYLNANKIAFLAWTSENICWKNGIVRLTNFHMGSALFYDFDPGIIKCLVFPTIIPPELNSENATLEKADVWGVCCLLYELLTNEVVHSHLLHIERDEVWRMLDKNGWRPKCPFNDRQLQGIFQKGWEEQPQGRISLDRLKCEILSYKNDL